MPAPPDALDLVPDRHAVDQATQWLGAISRYRHWSARLSFRATLAMDEALTNIVAYAFDATRTGQPVTPEVKLHCRCESERVVITIADNGRPYDPSRARPPALALTLDDAEIGGHGARLIAHYVNELCYCRQNDWNHLTLVLDADQA